MAAADCPLPAVVAAAAIVLPCRARSVDPTLTITGETIIHDHTGRPVAADVYVNRALLHQRVLSFTITVPLTVTAPGYQPWSLVFRAGGNESKTVTGPIRLQPIE